MWQSVNIKVEVVKKVEPDSSEMRGRSLRDNGHKVKWGKFVLYREVLVCDDPSKTDTQTL